MYITDVFVNPSQNKYKKKQLFKQNNKHYFAQIVIQFVI